MSQDTKNTEKQENNKQLNLFEKLSKITNELSAVAKNLSVNIGKASYKAVGEADVLFAVKPLEEVYRVYSFPVARKIIESGTMQNGEKNNLYMRVETTYRFVNLDNPTEFVDMTTYGDGVDTQDKAPGKAMTYSDKYALLKAYKIITGDDPDQNGSEDLKKMDAKKNNSIDTKLTPKQLELLNKLSDDAKVKLVEMVKKPLEELTVSEASTLIDKYKARGIL